MWIWITILALVVVVVIGFLLGIVGALESIDDGLLEADNAVSGAGGDTKPLPGHIKNINGNLTLIDTSLKPITGQADEILSALRSIRGSLVSVDGSLKDTSGSLVDTSGTLGNITGLLVDTSGTLGNISSSLVDTTGLLGRISPSLVDTANELVSVTNLATTIDTTLVRAQSVNSLGTNGIWRRVRFINGGSFEGAASTTPSGGPNPNKNSLSAVNADTTAITAGLRTINAHLTSICNAPVLDIPLPGLVNPGPC